MSVAGVLTWVGGSAGIYAFFARFDDLATEKTKADMAAILIRNPALQVSGMWPVIFNRMFDRIFGHSYLSLRFLIASVVTSMLIALTFAAFSYISYPGELGADLDQIRSTITYNTLLFAWPIFLIPDMVGLIKSRFILKRLGRVHATLLILIDLLSSVALTVFSVCLCLGAIAAISVQVSGGGFSDGWSWYKVMFVTAKQVLPVFTHDFMHNNPFHSPINAFFYAPMFTSLWAAFFYMSAIVFRSSSYILALATRFLDLQKKPFSVVGLGSVGIVTVISGCTAVLT